MSKFCPLCGAEIDENAKFCTACGSAIVNEAAETVTETVTETAEEAVESVVEPVTEAAPVYSAPVTSDPVINAYSYSNNTTASVEPQGSKVLAIIAMICGILSLLCCCWFGVIGIIFSIVAIVLGAISLGKKNPGKGMAITAVITGGLALILSIIIAAGSAEIANQLVNNPEFSSYMEQLEQYGYTF